LCKIIGEGICGKGFEEYILMRFMGEGVVDNIIIYLCKIIGERICGKGFEEYILMRFVGGRGVEKGSKKIKN